MMPLPPVAEMTAPAINELAASMIRLHGVNLAVKLADSYAADASAENDNHSFRRWASVAALIAARLELEKRFGKQEAQC
jgi:hypothetical protein